MIKLRKILSNILISIGMSGVFALFLIFVSPRFLFLGKFYSASDMTLALSRLSRVPEMTQTHRFFIVMFVLYKLVRVLNNAACILYDAKSLEPLYSTLYKTVIFLYIIRYCFKYRNSKNNLRSLYEFL